MPMPMPMHRNKLYCLLFNSYKFGINRIFIDETRNIIRN